MNESKMIQIKNDEFKSSKFKLPFNYYVYTTLDGINWTNIFNGTSDECTIISEAFQKIGYKLIYNIIR